MRNCKAAPGNTQTPEPAVEAQRAKAHPNINVKRDERAKEKDKAEAVRGTTTSKLKAANPFKKLVGHMPNREDGFERQPTPEHGPLNP